MQLNLRTQDIWKRETPKMSKITLLEFSESFKVLTLNDFYWNVVTPRLESNKNKEFEEKVIQTIINWKDWKVCPDFELLVEFLKKGGKLENVENFYNNIEPIKLAIRGNGCEIIYAYSKNVLKDRLPADIEKIFLRNLWKSYRGKRVAYKYAKYVVRNRLPVEFEKDCDHLGYIDFLKLKGHNISEVLVASSSLCYSFYRAYSYLPEAAHNYMLAMQLAGDRYSRDYFIHRKKDDKIIKNRLSMVDQSKTVKEIIDSM
jgi:hypothetical protein